MKRVNKGDWEAPESLINGNNREERLPRTLLTGITGNNRVERLSGVLLPGNNREKRLSGALYTGRYTQGAHREAYIQGGIPRVYIGRHIPGYTPSRVYREAYTRIYTTVTPRTHPGIHHCYTPYTPCTHPGIPHCYTHPEVYPGYGRLMHPEVYPGYGRLSGASFACFSPLEGSREPLSPVSHR